MEPVTQKHIGKFANRQTLLLFGSMMDNVLDRVGKLASEGAKEVLAEKRKKPVKTTGLLIGTMTYKKDFSGDKGGQIILFCGDTGDIDWGEYVDVKGWATKKGRKEAYFVLEGGSKKAEPYIQTIVSEELKKIIE